MGTILIIIGYGWAAIGGIDIMRIIDNPVAPSVNETYLGFVIIGHLCLYWIPGLLVGGIGSLLNHRKHMGFCPYCSERVNRQATVCKSCHRSVTPLEKPSALAEAMMKIGN